MLAACLGRIGGKSQDRVLPILVKLLEDPVLEGHAISGLNALGDVRAIEKVRPYLGHKMNWISKGAARAIKKLEKKRTAVSKTLPPLLSWIRRYYIRDPNLLFITRSHCLQGIRSHNQGELVTC